MSRRAYRIGIDVGGTFTKAALLDNATHEVVARASVHTTHEHTQGVAAGVVAVFRQVLTEAEVAPSEIVFLAHSTTQATNALLEGDVAPVGIIGMSSAQTARLAQQQAHIDPIELAPGRILETRNRFLLNDGLQASAVREAVEALTEEGAAVLVASSAFGVDNTAGEELVREIGADFQLPTTCGHEITKLYGLAPRTRTAVINASIMPRMIATADMTEKSVHEAGIDAPLMIMRSDGGVMDIHEMRRRPVLTMLSGPAASVAGALMHGNVSDGIYFEVGGTSTNLGVVRAGRPTLAYAQVGGHSTFVNSLDVRVLGVAGGSLIQVAGGEIVDVGPRSAHVAGLRYACFAEPHVFENARVVLIEPKIGDGDRYVAIETETAGRFALTTTCAANALALTTPEMHCHAPPDAAHAAFLALARFLGKEVAIVARSVLEAASDKIAPVIRALIKQYDLDDDQQLLIGEGGGVGAILPFLAQQLKLRYQISEDAEIISSIGAALAMVREVVERVHPNPTPDDIAALRREAIEAVTRLGADPRTVDVSIEIDRLMSRVRAVATGAAALRARQEQQSIALPAALRIAAGSFGRPSAEIELMEQTAGAFVFQRRNDPLHSVRVVDWEGNIRLQRSRTTVMGTAAGDWHETWQRLSIMDDGGVFRGGFLLYDKHIVDLTGLHSVPEASMVIETELANVEAAERVVLIVFGTGTI